MGTRRFREYTERKCLPTLKLEDEEKRILGRFALIPDPLREKKERILNDFSEAYLQDLPDGTKIEDIQLASRDSLDGLGKEYFFELKRNTPIDDFPCFINAISEVIGEVILDLIYKKYRELKGVDDE